MRATVLVLFWGNKCKKTNRFKTRATKNRTAKNRKHVKRRSIFIVFFVTITPGKCLE